MGHRAKPGRHRGGPPDAPHEPAAGPVWRTFTPATGKLVNEDKQEAFEKG